MTNNYYQKDKQRLKKINAKNIKISLKKEKRQKKSRERY